MCFRHGVGPGLVDVGHSEDPNRAELSQPCYVRAEDVAAADDPESEWQGFAHGASIVDWATLKASLFRGPPPPGALAPGDDVRCRVITPGSGAARRPHPTETYTRSSRRDCSGSANRQHGSWCNRPRRHR